VHINLHHAVARRRWNGLIIPRHTASTALTPILQKATSHGCIIRGQHHRAEASKLDAHASEQSFNPVKFAVLS
jgi:hypothetical protein